MKKMTLKSKMDRFFAALERAEVAVRAAREALCDVQDYAKQIGAPAYANTLFQIGRSFIGVAIGLRQVRSEAVRAPYSYEAVEAELCDSEADAKMA